MVQSGNYQYNKTFCNCVHVIVLPFALTFSICGHAFPPQYINIRIHWFLYTTRYICSQTISSTPFISAPCWNDWSAIISCLLKLDIVAKRKVTTINTGVFLKQLAVWQCDHAPFKMLHKESSVKKGGVRRLYR